MKSRLEAHARRIATIRDLVASIPETGAWSVMREANRELELAEREARALGEAVSVEAGDD